MIKRSATRICLSLMFALACSAQTPKHPLAFEVATVKVAAPVDMAAIMAGKAHVGTKIDASRVDIGSASLFGLICTAYALKPYQVTGPDWLKTATYDVMAKIPAGATAEQVPEMLQTLLADRFALKIHLDTREQPVYALIVAKGGAKLKESPPEAAPAADAPKPADKTNDKTNPDSMSIPTAQGDVKITRSAQGATVEMPGGAAGAKIHLTMKPGSDANPQGGLHLESSGTTMKALAELLSGGLVDRPVVDLTEMPGKYELGLDLSLADAMNIAKAAGLMPGGAGMGAGNPAAAAGAAPDPSGSTSIFASIQTLGLKLDPRKLPLDLLVVDHAEKTPTAN